MRSLSRSALVFVLTAGLLWSGSELAQAAPTPAPTPSPTPAAGTLGGLSADTSRPVAQGTSGSPVRDTPSSSYGSLSAPVPSRTLTGFDVAKSTVAARAGRSTSYRNPDGTQTTVFASEDVNYQDSTGAWQAVDNSVVTDASTGDLVNKANGWQARFGDASKGMTFKPSVKSTGVVSFVPVNAKPGSRPGRGRR